MYRLIQAVYPRARLLGFLVAALLLVTLAPLPAYPQIVGIDIGTKYLKIALVKRGARPSIVLNKESKRKTEFVVQFSDNARHFGSHASSNAARYPQSTFFNLKTLVGKRHDHKVAKQYAKDFGISITEDSLRGFLRFNLTLDNVEHSYTTEELIAMTLEKLHELVVAELKISASAAISAVLTVPPFFDQIERLVLIESARLAGFNVISCIHDTTAVAVNYASTRLFEVPETMVFYDIGAGSTTASLIRMSGKSLRTPLKLEVLNTAYDRGIGGLSVDAVLVDILSQKFVDAHASATPPPTRASLAADPEAQVRLLREAERVKQGLSVNTETGAFIEALHAGLTLKLPIMRDELEKRLEAETMEAFLAPVRKVMPNDGKSGVDAIVLFGGGPRVPIIQRWLQDLPGVGKVVRHVDGDEAAALGAVFYGATMSSAFRVRHLDIDDLLPYDIIIKHEQGRAEPVFNHSEHLLGTSRNVSILAEDGSVKSRLGLWTRDDVELGHIELDEIEWAPKVVEAVIQLELDRNGIVHTRNASLTTQTSVMLLGTKNTTFAHGAKFVPAYPVLTEAARAEFKKTLAKWHERERAEIARADAQNALESAVYEVRDKLQSDRLVKLTTAEERENVEKLREEAAEWLESNEASAETAQFTERLGKLIDPFKELQARVDRWVSLLRKIRKHGTTLNDSTVRRWADDTDDADVYNMTAVVEKLGELRALVDAKAEAERKEIERVRLERETLLAKMREIEKEKKRKKMEAAAKKKAANVTEVLKDSANDTMIDVPVTDEKNSTTAATNAQESVEKPTESGEASEAENAGQTTPSAEDTPAAEAPDTSSQDPTKSTAPKTNEPKEHAEL